MSLLATVLVMLFFVTSADSGALVTDYLTAKTENSPTWQRLFFDPNQEMCYLTGEWQHDRKKAIKIKKHGRLSVSLFRYGLDYVQMGLCCTNLSVKAFSAI